MLKIRINSVHKKDASCDSQLASLIHNLHLLLLDSNESGMNVIYSHFIVRNTMKESFMVGKKLHLTKSGGSEAGKPWTLKSGGSSIAALQKFTQGYLEQNIMPMIALLRYASSDIQIRRLQYSVSIPEPK